MIDPRSVFFIAIEELKEARRNRWLLLFAAIFSGLSLGLSLLGLSGLGTVGVAGFARTAASLLNLVMLVVPLMGLVLGAVSVSGEREQGTLLGLLAQPVTIGEVLLGKFLGLAAALAAAVLVGFGLSGLVIGFHAGPSQLAPYLGLVLYTLLLSTAFLGIGFLLSVFARRAAAAIGLALFAWLAFAFLSDLGFLGTAFVLELSPRDLLLVSLFNPAQAFKIAALDGIQGSLDNLGPAGRCALELFGDWLRPAFAGLLALWALVPFTASVVFFGRRGVA